ncbi:uncharacterized protein XM38_032910 [Halomicronema hongdechloris C2206]|uniref:Phage tail sheath protein n=1 Tax=Halomicronema hongdechloris C2206 TaxID=1641165 RepID=A0A1Z3HPU9_9CYAN|nr:phage tail sheath C-terminal domain-containing protein [Halomicronema hongdechloris]ASC72334.1 uncharacterized protein XM38_032910 [Halomicronema hongdechloris C2206]
MVEMIIPGTYITVRSEGLISAGRVATGIVGIVGTAASGPVGEPVTLSGFANAREVFGLPDDFAQPVDGSNPLTLVRTLEQLYNNGASSVVAVRVAGSSQSKATYAVRDSNGNSTVNLVAKTPGTWANDLQIEIAEAEEDCRIESEVYEDTFTGLNYAPIVPSAENQIRIYRGVSKLTKPLDIVYQEGTETKTPESGQVVVTVEDGSLIFATGEAPDAANGDRLLASYLVDQASCVQVNLDISPLSESYTVPDGNYLATLVNQTSLLVDTTPNATAGGNLPQVGVNAYFGTGSNTPGSNGAEAAATEYGEGLAVLADELINIVVLAGQDAEAMGSVLQAHLKSTEQTDHERIGVMGAPGDTVAEFLGHNIADDRLILVAPGMITVDGIVLPTAYTAAAVAGLIASLPVQTSLTNKPLIVPGLALSANPGQQIQLIKRNVLTVIPKLGYRIVKGLTTAGEGAPFSAIPTRRIVDYAKYGVRSAANPYIGRLNNARVRGALKATLDAFLTRMVEDEALTGYSLEVTATRAQEIAGEVNVTMTLQPTFSIDFIRVTMNLK